MKAALERVHSLEGLLPICAWCKEMRETDSQWVALERYICKRTTASFTHTICPDCAKRMT